MKYDNTKSLGQNAINGVDITEAEYKNEQGFCPKCHSYNLDYGSLEIEDDGMCYYPYKCEDCGQEGEEWYRLDFQGHNIYTEDGDVIEL